MNKSKLNLGANVGDIPRGVNRPEVNRPDLVVYLKTLLTLGELLATRPDLAVYKQPTWSL